MTTLHGGATFTQGERPRLYKIRRLVKDDDMVGEHYEYLHSFNGPIEGYAQQTTWVRDQIDGLAFGHFSEAVRICERLKILCRACDVIFHAVVPA